MVADGKDPETEAEEAKAQEAKVWRALAEVMDPEVPVISIVDLGVVYGVAVTTTAAGLTAIAVEILTTYSGCPAMKEIREGILTKLQGRFPKAELTVAIVHTVPWSTARMSAKGRKALKDYGIAPPLAAMDVQKALEDQVIPCPRCGAKHTELVSPFGATACKAFYRCLSCREPFEYFKCHIPLSQTGS